MLTLALLSAWLAPVNGPVDRAFAGGPDPFAPGLRRALVLRAEAGEAVSAPCTGRVTFAGPTPQGPAVTLRCGTRRATLMGLRPATRAGDRVRRGARVGTAKGDVSLSARAGGAYVDPARLLRRRALPPPAAPPPPPPRAAPPRTARPRAVPSDRAVAPDAGMPWPAPAGALLVAGVAASCTGVRLRVRRRRRLEPSASARGA